MTALTAPAAPLTLADWRAAYAAGATLEALWTLLGRTDEPRMTRFLAAHLTGEQLKSLDNGGNSLEWTRQSGLCCSVLL